MSVKGNGINNQVLRPNIWKKGSFRQPPLVMHKNTVVCRSETYHKYMNFYFIFGILIKKMLEKYKIN